MELITVPLPTELQARPEQEQVMGIEMLFHGIQASNVRGFSMYEMLAV